jgi:hypothetical protein
LEAHESTPEVREAAVTAQGLAAAATLLSQPYTLVVTNVPFLSRSKMGTVLGRHIDEVFSEERTELATVFLTRLFSFLAEKGCVAIVSPQNWLFLQRSLSQT